MATRSKNDTAGKKGTTATKQEDTTSENVTAAHEEALQDIEQDPDFSMQSPNDDLDEGETARLGEDKTGLV